MDDPGVPDLRVGEVQNAEPGQPTTVVTKDDFKYLPDVVALEVELDQADDLEEIFARESR